MKLDRARVPRGSTSRMPGPTCNQLSAAIRSSNGDRYGIGERLPIVCDRARRILIDGERERERSTGGLGLEGGNRRMELDRSRGRSFHRPRPDKVRFCRWLREDGGRGRKIARNGDCRERGNQRRRPRFATNNLWLKLFRSPSPTLHGQRRVRLHAARVFNHQPPMF